MSTTMNGLNMDDIFTDLINKEVISFIENQLNSTNFEYCIEYASKKGDNFMADIFRLTYNMVDNEEAKKSSIVLKLAPRHTVQRERFRTRQSFLREINMYKEVLSYFREFQLSKGVPLGIEGFNEHAKCYQTINVDGSEGLFLEDLNLSHFEMIDHREEPLTYDHVSLAMKAMGKLHAISFALKDQQPDKFKELTSHISENFWTMIESGMGDNLNLFIERFAECLKAENRLDLVGKMRQIIGSDIKTSIYKLVSAESAEPYAVICHGDVTINNVMFRKNAAGQPIEIQLFDWQFSRFASPVTEIVLFLLCCSTKELRDKHFEDFVKIYYEGLSELLTRLGSDPEKIFPYETLLKQFKQFGKYTIFVAALLMPMLCAEVDTIPDFDRLAVEVSENGTQREDMFRIADEAKRAYTRRVTDIFADLQKFGYI